jgi:hypothetical protein
MPEFEVAVTALGCIRRVIKVEADDEDAAGKAAIAQAKADGDFGWKFNGRYDDGKPNCELDATEICNLEEDEMGLDDGDC